jgi:hypothetical protein
MARREWLRLGGLGLLSLAAKASGEEVSERLPGFGKAKSVIMVFCNGGQSQFEMWDPKPSAPLDVRGEFETISTAIPGVRFGEHMPRIAKIADRFTVIRSMSHEDLDHGSAVYLALTGHYHARRSGNPPITPNDAPTFGAILRRLSKGGRLADAVHLNAPALVPFLPSPGQYAGLLGGAFEPLVVGNVVESTAAIPGLELTPDLPTVRMSSRMSLKESLDRSLETLSKNERVLDLSRKYGQAYQMLSSPQAREAFNLDAEQPSVRDRYGRHRSGQALLLARRLVEAGVPYINVIWNHSNRGQDKDPSDTDVCGWDTHNDIFDALKNQLLPRFDESFSALLEDLDQRGLLEQTLVICMGEFGRAPQVALEKKFIGATPGRKHWANAYSLVMAGAGVRRGAVVGATDRLGAEPTTERYGPWDVAATMFSALGIDPHGHYTDAFGRPFSITEGRPMTALYQG